MFTEIDILGTGPVVVLLHSSLSSKEQWKGLVKQLSPNFTCANVDLQGYGSMLNADIDYPYTLKCEVERIAALLNNNQLFGPYYVVGHSFGGAVALRFADEFKEQVKALCVFEPVAFHLLVEEAPSRKQVSELAVNMDNVPAYTAASIFTNYWNGEGYFDALPQRIQKRLMAMIDKVAMDFDAIINETKTLLDYSVSISANVLLMTGKQSRTAAKDVVNVIETNLRHVRKVEIDAGHMAPLVRSELVNPVIVDYLHSNSQTT
ncbi:alpha/beta fold hydrolase [Shewanella surugensis]|uniref:Alpha/beta hydrolase n=1 Tax=Shewanella surugensis TaxID=212020 RepID=A0ABT0LAF5_9GAMM|nr:alpha/beta hydrolase [Shewanella surugensis]MCL1124625.1 alpha/beta hydrolase [Shewanella surugensis]